MPIRGRLALPGPGTLCRLAVTIACGSLGACAPAPSAPVAALQTQDGWSIARDPVLPAGSMRPQAMWNDASVLKTDRGYVMYLTTSVDEPWQPPVLPFRAVSADGKSWTLDPAAPLLRPVPPYASIETPSVVRFGGKWHMFFTGIRRNPDPSPMSIGHAISSDGVNWTIDKPVLLAATGKADDWRSYLVAEPGAVVVGGKLLVYFSAVGARAGGSPPQDQSIGVIASSDGASFSAPRRVLTQGPLYPAAQGYAGYSAPAATVADGKVHLFYSVAHFQSGANPEWRQVAIHHATSGDGIVGFVEDDLPLVTTASLAWTGGEVLAPAPLVDGSRLRLWFSGHVPVADLGPLIRRGFSGPEFGIGEMSIELAKNGGEAPQAGGVAPSVQGNVK